MTAKKPEEDHAINVGVSHTCTDTHRVNAHLGHLSGLLQEAFHLLLSIRNVHCRSADDRETESLLQKRDAKGNRRGKKLKNNYNITSKLKKTLIISVLHQYHHWEQGLEMVKIRETERSGYSIWVKKLSGLLKRSSEFNHYKHYRFRRV